MIAALHYNENSEREQATTRAGVKRYSYNFSKASGEFVVKKIKTKATHGKFSTLLIRTDVILVQETLTSEIIKFFSPDFGHNLMNCLLYSYHYDRAELRAIAAQEKRLVPGPVSAGIERPDKAQAVATYEDRVEW